MSGRVTVAVVLLTWNSREEAERCLERVRASEGVDADVLLVDNGSTADDAAYFRGLLGEERVIGLGENRGYAGGMNAGLEFWRRQPGDAPVLIVTPDAELGPDVLAKLVAELDRTPDSGIVGPVVVYSRETGRLAAGGRVDAARARAPLLPGPLAEAPYDADWIDGCCMLVRRAVVREIGEGFDERFFIYFEETDFCGRVRAAGWRVRVVPDAVVDHPKSPGTLPPYYFYYMVRNSYLFWAKNFGTSALRVGAHVAVATLRSWGAVARSLLPGREREEWRRRLRDARLQARAAVLGTRDHLRRRYGPMPDGTMPDGAMPPPHAGRVGAGS